MPPCRVPSHNAQPKPLLRHKHAGEYVPWAGRARGKDNRPGATRRGYGAKRKAIRERVLRDAGIPKDEWALWDVHHNPPYDPAYSADHADYQLIPLRHGSHSRETVQDRARGLTRMDYQDDK
jgi:hypothetical protein